MMVKDLIHTREELEAIGRWLQNDIKRHPGDATARYIHVGTEVVSFRGGKKESHSYANSNINTELMSGGVFYTAGVPTISLDEMGEAVVKSELAPQRFSFDRQHSELLNTERIIVEAIPSETSMYDSELKQFSKEHRGVTVSRQLDLQQEVIVNSQGGLAIQSIPFFGINYQGGLQPIKTIRGSTVVCNTDDDIKRLTDMIQNIPDPTLEGKIRNSKSFAEAFHHLHGVSRLKHEDLSSAGIELQSLYDVIMLTGVPIHEIFGHHFEVPVHPLNYGESGTFKYGQRISDASLVMADNPHIKVSGFRPFGFTHFDAYGNPRDCQTHIKDGHVVGFIGSEYADTNKIKGFMESDTKDFRGGARVCVDGQFPQNRMTLTTLDGTKNDLDLEGKILVVSNSGQTNPQMKTYTVDGEECYIVRNGQPHRIVPLRITGGINQALENLSLGEKMTYQTGMCGKPEPLQGRVIARVPVSQYAPIQTWAGQQVYPMPIEPRHAVILQK